MGTSGPKIVKAVKYFNEIETTTNIKKVDSIKDINQKLRLTFYLQDCKNGCSYSINALLLETEKKDFSTEEKKAQDGEVSFENFYVCDYFFETLQNIQITIFRDDAVVITFTTALGYIIGSRNNTLAKKIENQEILNIKSEKLGTGNSYTKINIEIKQENNDQNYFKKNKLFFEITCNSRKIYSSESISENGTFNQIKIPGYLLSPTYTVKFYNVENKSLKASYDNEIGLLNKKEYMGKLRITIPISKKISLYIYDNSEFYPNYSFYDFISAGVKIKLSLGIDFTGSNGHPLDKDSLHSLLGPNPNDYEKVIKLIGSILQYYSYDQLYPVYGFGAILEGSEYSAYNIASMCFNINFQNSPEIHAIDNVLNIYHNCLNKLTFAGPTYFSPIIRRVINNIKQKKNELEYNILMILTDGNIDDLENTIDSIVDASFEPLSIIIVGLGNTDFSKMVILDGNEIPLISSKNVQWFRDDVQFIHFNEFRNDEKRLAKEILEEIPRQIIEFYTKNNYTPEKIKKKNNDLNHLNSQNMCLGSSINLPSENMIRKQNIINNNNNNNYINNNFNNNYNNNNYNNNNYNNNINNNQYNNFEKTDENFFLLKK